MTVKRCSHKISINLDFLKRIFTIPEKSALHYSTISTSVEIRNDMTKEDLKALANWIIVSNVGKVETKPDTKVETKTKEKETEKK
jgi:hypothetical protein